MHTETTITLAALLLFGGVADAQNGPPAYDAEWVGWNTSQADTARWPRSFRAGDLDQDGDLDYAVIQGASIPGLTLHWNRGDGSFEEPEYLATVTGGFWDDVLDLELVDLDLDGDLDIVVANAGNAGTSNKLALHRNLGGGTFAPFVQLTTGDGPAGLASGDVNGDGFPDVLTANYGYIGQGSSVSVHLNDGSGGLGAPADVAVADSPWKIAAGDLDGDGDVDFAVACEDETLTVLRNTGGAFERTDYPVFPSGYGTAYQAGVELGDLDNDGDLDAVYSSNRCGFEPFSGAGAVGLLYNQGDGTFAAPVALTTLPETQGGIDLALADWNRDGWLDVASAHEFDGEWLLFESDGTGGFLGPQRFFAAASAIAVDGSDVTGDGIPDLEILGRDSLELCVYANPGDGEFAQNGYWPFVLTAGGIFDPIVSDGLSAADIDLDGDPDLGMAWAKIQTLDGGQSVLRNQGDGTFAMEPYGTPVGAANFVFADIDGDLYPDMLSTDAFSSRLRGRLNLSGAGFSGEAFWPFASADDLEVADLDLDGDLDAIGLAWSTLVLAANDGGGNFAVASSYALTTFGTAIAIGDVDADGDPDLMTNTHWVGLETSLNNGDGTFDEPIPAVADWAPKGMVLADLDLDGDLDAAVSSWSDDDHDHPTIQVLPGHGQGSFGLPATYLGSHQIGTSSNAGDIVATDFDGDGDLDLATGNYWSNDVTVFENAGDGTYGTQVRYGSGPGAWGTVAADFDGDGFEDVAVGITIGPSIDFYPAAVVLPSNGSGAWKDLGHALASSAFGAPRLDATSPLEGGQPFGLEVDEAAPSSSAAMVIGLQEVDLPALGGTLVPFPSIVLPLVTDGAGAAELPLVWPAGLPAGFTVFAQAWIFDATAPQGLSATNGLAGTELE